MNALGRLAGPDIPIPQFDQSKIAFRFKQGLPGMYEADVTIEAVPLAGASRPRLQLEWWNRVFRERGLPARARKLSFRGYKNQRSLNPVRDILDDLRGMTSVDRGVADEQWTVTLELLDTSPWGGMKGLGAPTAVAWVAILGGIALVFETIDYFSGKNLMVDAVRSIGSAAGGAITEAGRGVAKGILPVILVVGAGLWALNEFAPKTLKALGLR